MRHLKPDSIEKCFYLLGLALAFIFILSAGILHFFHLSLPEFSCNFHTLTGYFCPGCGGTRAVMALLRGEIAAALRYNIFAVCLIVYYCAFMLSYTLYLCTKKTPYIHFHLVQIYMGVSLLIISWIVKNITYL